MIRSMMATCGTSLVATAMLALFLLTGCGQSSGPDQTKQRGGEGTGKTAPAAKEATADGQDNEADIKAARAELNPEDRQLVEAQEFCPVMPDHRLGVMGTPVKVMVKDHPVFVCCKSCRRRALADPDETLAKVAELKAKVKADAETKK